MENKTTFWNYIQNNHIEIPIIQRDYAQGRLGKEYLRRSFLGDLKKALDNEPPFKDSEMKLDFVYGSTENGKLNPLDGQQRLTTLWLLHWYVALRAGLFYQACPILKKFSYETRISSREFCEQLCEPKNFEYFSVDEGIVDYITNQTWFYSTWKQDPTIQAMLRMLSGTIIKDKNGDDIVDGIEEIFICTRQPKFNEYWRILCSDKCPIKFYHLALTDFGLSDDLYIKMNARGKQLTPFENFKADLIGYIKKRTEEEQDDDESGKWSSLLDPSSGIPIQMDKGWTDIFWKNRSVGVLHENGNIKNANKIDEIYFAFINRFFWNELFISKDKEKRFILDVGDGEKDGVKTPTIEIFNPSYRHLNEDRYELYLDFSPYLYYKDNKDNENELKKIPYSFFEELMTVLGNYAAYKDPKMPICEWNQNFHFIPQYETVVTDEKEEYNIEIMNKDQELVLKVSSLKQIQRIVFFAVCKYFKDGEADTVSLERWMRVVWNLVSGEDEGGRAQIRNAQGIRTAIKFIDEQLESHSVYDSLKELSITGNSEFDERCKEEIEKAKQIIDENGELRPYNGSLDEFKDKTTWEVVIKKAEETAFFKGAIRFLFTNENGNVDENSWKQFDIKWKNANDFYIDDKDVKRRTLIKFIDYLDEKDILYLGTKYGFSNKTSRWKSILLDSKLRKATHNFLMNQIGINNNSELKQQLLLVLNNISEDMWILQDWKGNNNVLTNYSVRRDSPNNGYVFAIGTQRHAIIQQLNEKDEITIQIPESTIGEEFYKKESLVCYRGLYATIIYKDYIFRYEGDNELYLMDKNNPDVYLSDTSTGNKFSLTITDTTDLDLIISQLETLIQDSNNV